jgi:integrase/recombinase XerD
MCGVVYIIYVYMKNNKSNAGAWLRRNYLNKDGQAQVYYRVYLHGKYVQIGLGVYCAPDEWDAQKATVVAGDRRREKNLIIKEAVGRGSDILLRYQVLKKTITADLFVKEFENPSAVGDFYAWMLTEIENRSGQITPTSKQQHISSLHKMQAFRKSMQFAEIDKNFVEGWEKWMRMKLGNKPNTVHSGLKTLKTYVRRAIAQGLMTVNPFENFILRKERTVPEFLSEAERDALLDAYRNAEMKPTHRRVMRWYLFACFTGLRISDMRRMQHAHIRPGYVLRFKPLKTENVNGMTIEIPLVPNARQLIQDEAPGRSEGVLFDMYSDQRINIYLKEALALAGIVRPMSFHSARHTFATTFLRRAKNANGILMLQRLLGHSKIASTMVYSHVLNDDIISAMQDFGQESE